MNADPDVVRPGVAAKDRFLLGPHALDFLPASLQIHREVLQDIRAVARLGVADVGDLAFCDRLPADGDLDVGVQATVMCPPELLPALQLTLPACRLLPVADARAAFIDWTHELLLKEQVGVSLRLPNPGRIATTAQLGAGTQVHPLAQIDDDVVLGAHCVVHRGVWLQRGAVVGDGCVLGGVGLNAYRSADGRLLGFPHLAGLLVGPGCVIGAQVVMVRGILTSTVIGGQTMVGNLCNIGHGAELGQGVWMSVGCLLGGHVRLGDHATLGMGVQVRDNLRVGMRAQLAMGAVVVRAVGAGLSVMGNPARVVPPLTAGPDRHL